MSDSLRIEGKVAAILNIHELVINRGEEDGVKEGMKFAVLNKNAIDIKDPETGQPLGSVDVAKVLVEAIRVEPRLTVCRTFIEIKESGLGIPDIFGPSRRIRETLRSSDKPAASELPSDASYVAIGDPIREVKNRDEYWTKAKDAEA